MVGQPYPRCRRPQRQPGLHGNAAVSFNVSPVSSRAAQRSRAHSARWIDLTEDSMKIVVIGGTGLIGSKLVALLRERGQEVLAASPNSGVNTVTGEGLPQALAGARVVVDVANSPSFEDKAVMKFFAT